MMKDGLQTPDVRHPRDPETVRRQVVLAGHILAQHGVLDAFGHVSARHPQSPERFFMTRRVAPGQAGPDDVHELNLDGNLADGSQVPLFGERYIHSAIYRQRPDVNAVVHSHSRAIIAIGLVPGHSLRPVSHMCGFLGTDVPVFEIREVAGESTNMLIDSQDLGKHLANRLGDANIVLMRRHGSTVVGASLPQAVYRAIYAEENSSIQTAAEAFGEPTYLTEGEARASEALAPFQIERAWNWWLSRLPGEGPAGA
jgi:HCOMODA/2-hydroxy-3-carboxy-muconic semialdehyde decarboxylase